MYEKQMSDTNNDIQNYRKGTTQFMCVQYRYKMRVQNKELTIDFDKVCLDCYFCSNDTTSNATFTEFLASKCYFVKRVFLLIFLICKLKFR